MTHSAQHSTSVFPRQQEIGQMAQLVARIPCKDEVIGSTPVLSITFCFAPYLFLPKEGNIWNGLVGAFFFWVPWTNVISSFLFLQMKIIDIHTHNTTRHCAGITWKRTAMVQPLPGCLAACLPRPKTPFLSELVGGWMDGWFGGQWTSPAAHQFTSSPVH